MAVVQSVLSACVHASCVIGAGGSAIECRQDCRVILAGLVATENRLERPNELANTFRTYLIGCGRPPLIVSDLKPSGCVSKRASSSEGSGCDDCHLFDSGSYRA